MRITSGQHRGRVLQSPEGLKTRPTSDRARQAVFNILLHGGWRKAADLSENFVLDGFSGTGAMGLEALSRGAAHVVFVDSDRLAMAACNGAIASS